MAAVSTDRSASSLEPIASGAICPEVTLSVINFAPSIPLANLELVIAASCTALVSTAKSASSLEPIASGAIYDAVIVFRLSFTPSTLRLASAEPSITSVTPPLQSILLIEILMGQKLEDKD